MKIVYSQLKQFLPGLKKPIRQLANDLTMIGHFANSLEKKQGEEIISLEVRQNRGDCLGYWGIAKDLSVFYQIPFKTPSLNLPKTTTKKSLDIKITATKAVERVMAVKISNLNNSSPPVWLKKFLALHEINSLNTIIDLTNYVSFLYGIPCHAFDAAKSASKLIWEINRGQYRQITTFDRSRIFLEKGDFLISNGQKVLSLPFIGGRNSGIDLKTKETIVEMADYNRVIIRQQAKRLNVSTEAGIRLEKDLDPQLIPQALGHLVKLILENCGGKINSPWYDYYPQKRKPVPIKFRPSRASALAGIKIPSQFSLKVLKSLGCQTKKENGSYLVAPPSLRKDLNLEEDLIEEVIRFYGYEKIPTCQPLAFKRLRNITPPIIYLIESLKNILTQKGYDEIRSWPLIRKKDYFKSPWLSDKAGPVILQNSPDKEHSCLRGAIISSLISQIKRYQKYKIFPRQFLEIGKVFYQEKGNFKEHYSLGLYHQKQKQLKKDLKELSLKLGVNLDHSLVKVGSFVLAEINLEWLLGKIKKIPKSKPLLSKSPTVVELKKQTISLDANVFLNKKENPFQLIKKYCRKIGKKYLWRLVITDLFTDPQKKGFKYTFRAFYYNLDAKKAKKIHLKAFNLKTPQA